MINKFKIILLLLGIILPTAFGLANSGLTTEKDGDGLIVINQNSTNGEDRSSSISASIDGHSLYVSFLQNIGQVTIEISNIFGVTLNIEATDTPSGYMYYIPLTGHYTVTFTLENGDEYYGEFDILD